MPPVNGFRDSIEMIYDGLHSFISLSKRLKYLHTSSQTAPTDRLRQLDARLHSHPRPGIAITH